MLVAILLPSMFILDILFWLWADRIARKRPRTRVLRWIVNTFMTIQLGSLAFIVVGRVASERTDEFLPRFLLSAVFLWHFILLPVGSIVALIDVLIHATRKPADATQTPEPQHSEVTLQPNRRDFLRAVAAAAPPVATVLTTGFALTQQDAFRIRSMTLPLRALPAELDGLTIAHVTDIHVGRFTEGAVLRRIVEATNQLHADLVLLTGDLINHALADLPAALDAVKRMDSRYGIYMCEGNHDLMENREKFESRVRNAGIPLLINENRVLNVRSRDVQILGLRWGSLTRGVPQRGDEAIAESMKILTPQIRPDAFPILLAHHPHAFDPALDAGIPLTLSGHTHGGQIMASQRFGFGPMMFRYWSGLYERNDAKLVVSNGTGNWFPLRINAPAEIVHITLRKT